MFSLTRFQDDLISRLVKLYANPGRNRACRASRGRMVWAAIRRLEKEGFTRLEARVAVDAAVEVFELHRYAEERHG